MKMMRVTPSLARKWLEHNTINRPLRPTVVDGLRTALMRGEYKVTHQGVAFADSGELLDGQHRLTAISELPDTFSVQMLVCTGLARDAFQAIDIGLKRSHGDVLHIPSGLAAVSRFMAVICETERSGITPQLLIPYANGAENSYMRLLAFCPKNSKAWSSAAVRTAAILRLSEGADSDYVCISYHALIHAEFDSMSPIVQALYRQQVKGLVRVNGFDMFCRAYKAFDPRSQELATIQISDTSSIVAKARDSIKRNILGQKIAAQQAAKKVIAGKFTKATA